MESVESVESVRRGSEDPTPGTISQRARDSTISNGHAESHAPETAHCGRDRCNVQPPMAGRTGGGNPSDKVPIDGEPGEAVGMEPGDAKGRWDRHPNPRRPHTQTNMPYFWHNATTAEVSWSNPTDGTDTDDKPAATYPVERAISAAASPPSTASACTAPSTTAIATATSMSIGGDDNEPAAENGSAPLTAE